MKTIAIEEHFILPEFVDYLADTAINLDHHIYRGAVERLTGFDGWRIEAMDENKVDYSVLSLAGPGVQVERDTEKAIRLARKANDELAKEIQKRPTRFGGVAHLAMQDPKAAADELERCMKDLKFQGAMINGTTLGWYLDADRYNPFWERAADLKAPIYIHPANPVDKPYMYMEHPEMFGPVWSWTVETASHALRLVFSGVFERYPDAKLVLGHMGETLPYLLWRFDSRWEICKHGRSLKKKPSEYIRENILITTSGVCSDAPLTCAISALGADNIMFAMDFPFENPAEAVDWFNAAPISEADSNKIRYENAKRWLPNIPI